MDANPNLGSGHRKEIRCRDCGHVYSVAEGQRSSRCTVCGNIEFYGDGTASAARGPVAEAHPFPPPGASAYVPPLESLPDQIDELARFRQTPDGFVVQEILSRYQVGWQLWAKLVENFGDPAYHAAYLAHVVGQHEFAQATAHYQEHRSVMLLSPETRWESDVAELMLGRLETLSTLRMAQEGSNGFRLPIWVYTLPLESRTVRLGWFLLGGFLMSRLFHVF